MLEHAEKFPSICVLGAGCDQVNGIYQLFGQMDGERSYINGIYFIIKNR
jgi:hypothetical protein